MIPLAPESRGKGQESVREVRAAAPLEFPLSETDTLAAESPESGRRRTKLYTVAKLL
jgi:hypothetical protein